MNDLNYCGRKESSLSFFDYNEKLQKVIVEGSKSRNSEINLDEFSKEEIAKALVKMYTSYKVCVEIKGEIIRDLEKAKETIKELKEKIK